MSSMKFMVFVISSKEREAVFFFEFEGKRFEQARDKKLGREKVPSFVVRTFK